MPAMLDDPTAPVIYRVSGPEPYPSPGNTLPTEIIPRQVTLRDRTTIATLLPFSAPTQIPSRLLRYLSDLLNAEIEKGDTYPMISPLPLASFGPYWFQNFGAVMVLGEVESIGEMTEMEDRGVEWGEVCLGSFYIKPNYPGRSSHVCNGGFLVADASRNKGVGRLMGEGYLEWAPKLGYSYSVFNLVYETNVASCRIWDALGFKRIGRVKGCGALRSHPDALIDAIIYGRDLGPEGEDFVSEERFDKIRYYLKHNKYPNGADRAEKSRLRSAATHYHLVPGDDGGEEKLMLKDKEVVADPQRQYEIARQVHAAAHGGINKTTATIAERFHWVRIKETVSLVIKNCPDCKEGGKAPSLRPDPSLARKATAQSPVAMSSTTSGDRDPNRDIERLASFNASSAPDSPAAPRRGNHRSPTLQGQTQGQTQAQQARHTNTHTQHVQPPPPSQQQQQIMAAHVQHLRDLQAPMAPMRGYENMPLDPAIMAGYAHHSHDIMGLTSGPGIDPPLHTMAGLDALHPSGLHVIPDGDGFSLEREMEDGESDVKFEVDGERHSDENGEDLMHHRFVPDKGGVTMM